MTVPLDVDSLPRPVRLGVVLEVGAVRRALQGRTTRGASADPEEFGA